MNILMRTVFLAGCCGLALHNAAAEERACTRELPSCPADSYCKFPEGTCGENGVSGTCEEIPQMCTMIYSPVCGCDNNTYASMCTAASHSVSVRSRGECTPQKAALLK
jgi:hypothetical protein